MAEITKATDASMDASTGMFAGQITGLYAGETIGAVDACYIKSDGKIWRASGAAANTLAVFAGFAPHSALVGEPLTLYNIGARFRYAKATLTPGAKLFLSSTVLGGLADVATTGDAAGTARVINTEDIVCVRGAA